MAFLNKDMSVIAYANGFTLWHYKSQNDLLQTIKENPNYFSKIHTLMNEGDLIIVNAKDNTQILCVDKIECELIFIRSL